MARRKRKSRAKGFVNSITSILLGTGVVLLKLIPLVIILTLSSGAILGVRNALYADSNLAVQRVLVEPSQALNDRTRQHLESKIIGENILSVDLKEFAASLEKDAKIKSAHVIRDFPATIRVRVNERKPVGLIQFGSKGKYGLISDDGVVLDVIDKPVASMIQINVFSLSKKYPTRGMQLRNRGFDEGVRFLKAFEEHPLAIEESIRELNIDHLGNVSIVLGGGPTVRLGRNPSERFPVIEKMIPVLETHGRQNIEYVDLQYDDVIVKKKKG